MPEILEICDLSRHILVLPMSPVFQSPPPVLEKFTATIHRHGGACQFVSLVPEFLRDWAVCAADSVCYLNNKEKMLTALFDGTLKPFETSEGEDYQFGVILAEKRGAGLRCLSLIVPR